MIFIDLLQFVRVFFNLNLKSYLLAVNLSLLFFATEFQHKLNTLKI